MDTPILFLIFNRPETTRVVFEAIRQSKPKKLFIAADGPRDNRADEKLLCEEARKITTLIDWPCEVKTLFREKNLGCKVAVSSAITWFFENVDRGIILEDDCVPNESFFYFCNKMLNLYKNEPSIMMISGTNYLNSKDIKSDHFLSEYYSIWGWATWKKAWQKYDISMRDWPHMKKNGFIPKKMGWVTGKFYEIMFNDVFKNNVDTWDTQWAYSCLKNNGLCVTPSINLISNIGNFGSHGKGDQTNLYKDTGSFSREHIFMKQSIKPNLQADKIQFKNIKIKKTVLYHFLYTLPIKIKRCIKKS